jgi:hypothetical protein
MNKKSIFYLLLILCLCIACESRIQQSFNLISNIDSTPPKLNYIESQSPYSVEIVFDEILSDRDKIELTFNNEKISNFSVKTNIVKIFRKQALIAGNKYSIKIKVEDLNGNSTFLESFVYTKNNNMADVLISEISTKGTTKNCDKVELVVTKSGSLAGIVVSDGFNDNYEDRCTLPDIYVNEGEFIVISFKDSNEESFKSENKKGLSSNNGCVLVLDNPSYNAKILDCIIYSNNKSENSEGFASNKTLLTAKTLVSLGQWENTYPLASAAVDTTCETSTRTINRKYSNNYYFVDTDSCEDFYVTVTSGDSFGYENNLEVYNN